MITIEQLIAVLFKVIILITTSSDIPQDVKNEVVAQITQAVASERQATASAPYVPTYQPSSYNVDNDIKIDAMDNSNRLATLGVVNKLPDGRYQVSVNLNGATKALVRYENPDTYTSGGFELTSHSAKNPLDRMIEFPETHKGTYTYTVTSWEGGKEIGVVDGTFVLE